MKPHKINKNQLVRATIYLTNKQKPMEIMLDQETAIDFTDFINNHEQTNYFTFHHSGANGKKKYIMICNKQVQAFEFDSFGEDD